MILADATALQVVGIFLGALTPAILAVLFFEVRRRLEARDAALDRLETKVDEVHQLTNRRLTAAVAATAKLKLERGLPLNQEEQESYEAMQVAESVKGPRLAARPASW